MTAALIFIFTTVGFLALLYAFWRENDRLREELREAKSELWEARMLAPVRTPAPPAEDEHVKWVM